MGSTSYHTGIYNAKMKDVRGIIEKEHIGLKIVCHRYGTSYGILSDKTIVVVLWRYNPKTSEFWWKSIHENEFPHYYDIPLKWVPLNGTGCEKWRNAVINHHISKKMMWDKIITLNTGDTIYHNGKMIQFQHIYSPTQIMGIQVDTQKTYRYKINQISFTAPTI